MRRSHRRVSLMAFAVSALAVVALVLGTAIPSAGAKTPKHKKHTTTTTLSGTWSGQYSGAYSGTFTLKWTQSQSKLSGKIDLSSPSSTYAVDGSVNGSAINFGTLGGAGVTYTGSVSGKGKSMSGSYQSVKGGGSWSANKTS